MFIRHRLKSVLRINVSPMPWGLNRYYGTGSLHFITWSCYRRQPLLNSSARRDRLLTVLEKMRTRYRFALIGYVVMPEHLHLLGFRAGGWPGLPCRESIESNGCPISRVFCEKWGF